MPIVTVQMYDGRSMDQKRELVKGITEVVARICRRHADVIEQLATQVHALTMVLVEKRLVTVERLQAARKHLDLAYDITQALQIRALIKDIDEIETG